MKRLNKIIMLLILVAVGIGFSGCDITDDGKSPLIEIKPHQKDWTWINLQSRDDETIINNMTIIGRNGKCNIKLGTGGYFGFTGERQIKYSEKIPYGDYRIEVFWVDSCPPKNGKYEIELNTNFGTYYYEIDRLVL